MVNSPAQTSKLSQRGGTTDLLLGVITCAAALLAYIQTINFPFVPFTDAICFLPQAVSFGQGKGLRNVYTFLYLPDGAFVWHGFLLPLVLGGLFGTDTYPEVTSSLAILNVLSVLFLSVALFRLSCDWKPRVRLLFVGLSLLVQVGFLQGVLGRPETLSTLLISGGLLAWSCRPSPAVYICLGVLIGLLGVTSPIPAVLTAGFLGAAICVRCRGQWSILSTGMILCLAALITVAVAFWIYPYSIIQWISGIREHAENLAKNPDAPITFRWILQQFVITSGRFASGLILIAGWAIVVLALLRLRSERPACSLLSLSLVSLILAFTTFMTLGAQWYYILCLFPLAAGVVASLPRIETATGTIFRNGFLLALAISSLDPLLLQAGRLLGYKGISLPEARRMFAEDFKTMPGKVAVSMDLAVLSDTTERLEVFYDYVPPCDEPDSDWLIAQQYCYFYAEPPTYKNFKLIKNRFAQKRKLPGRLAQWFGVNGYGYAVYQRSSPRSPIGSR